MVTSAIASSSTLAADSSHNSASVENTEQVTKPQQIHKTGVVSSSSTTPPSCTAAATNSTQQQQQPPRRHNNRICRDFAQGICRRMYCRVSRVETFINADLSFALTCEFMPQYPHVKTPDQVMFCHDYQNTSCPRINCK